jgi:hypothetical protein
MSDSIVLIEDGPDRKRMRVELSSYQGHPLLSIREWYKDKSSGELKPSNKGIALTRNNYLAVKSAIQMHHDQIMEHLRITANDDLSSADTSEIKGTHGRRLQPVSKVNWSISNFRPLSSIFQIDFHGPLANVNFNQSHPYVARLEHQAGADGKLQTLAEFIVGMELARTQLMDEGLMEPATVFELEADRSQRILTHLAGNLE